MRDVISVNWHKLENLPYLCFNSSEQMPLGPLKCLQMLGGEAGSMTMWLPRLAVTAPERKQLSVRCRELCWESVGCALLAQLVLQICGGSTPRPMCWETAYLSAVCTNRLRLDSHWCSAISRRFQGAVAMWFCCGFCFGQNLSGKDRYSTEY